MLKIEPICTKEANHIRQGGLDANQQTAIRFISDGQGNPCRHCLEDIKTGDAILLFAYSPFKTKHAYAEVGPIFIHEKQCQRYKDTHQLPPSFLKRAHYMMRAYNKDTNAIIEDSGQRIDSQNITKTAKTLLKNPDVGYIHLRSSSNTCFSCAIVRA